MKHFCRALEKDRGKEIHMGCSDVQEDQCTQNCHMRDANRAPEPSLDQPLVSPLLPQPWLQGCRGKEEGWTTPCFLLGKRRKMKGKMRPGWLSVGCKGKVSIKAMRPSASLCLTAGLSGADSWSAGWLPCLAHRSTLPLYTPGSQPARPGHADTGSSMVSLPLPPEMLPIMGIIMIWNLSRPWPAWRRMAAKQSGGIAERGARSC